MTQQELLTKLHNDVLVRKKQIELLRISLGDSDSDLKYFFQLLILAEKKFKEVAEMDDDAYLIWKLQQD